MLHPVDDVLERVGGRRAGRGRAVLRAGGEEQPGEGGRALRAEGVLDSLVVLDRPCGKTISSASPCQIRIFPPSRSKALRSGLLSVPMTANLLTPASKY